MRKSKFIKSTFILIIGGMITKILGMLIKIIMTRMIGTEGIGIYMLINPTFMLFLTLAGLGMPVAISTMVAKNKYNSKKLISSVIPFSLLLNIIIIIIIFFGARFLSNILLKEPRSYYPILCIAFVLPFVSISSIIRGYFFGKEKMIPHVLSNISEDVIKLAVLVLGIPLFLKYGIKYAVSFIVLSNIAAELAGIIVMYFFLPKKISFKKDDFKPQKREIREVMGIGLPATGSRLIGTIGAFFEPIILTYVLLKCGYTNNFLVNEYGIINGYVLPLLLMPSFFSSAISQALIPVVSRHYEKRNMTYIKNKVLQAILISLLIGVPITLLFLLFPKFFLYFIYNNIEGVEYLKILAPIFLIFYIQSPITSALQAMGKAKDAMMGTLKGMIIRTIVLFVFSYMKIGMWGLIISMTINIIYVTIYQATKLNKYLKKA